MNQIFTLVQPFKKLSMCSLLSFTLSLSGFAIISSKPIFDSVSERLIIDKLNAKASMLWDTSLMLCNKYSKEALVKSKHINYKKGEVEAYTNIGNLFISQKNFLSALDCFFSAQKIADNFGLVSLQSNVYKRIGNTYNILKRYDQAKIFFTKGIKRGIIAKDTFNICDNYIGMGMNAHDKGDSDSASICYKLALQILISFHNPTLTSKVYRALGDLYLSLNDYSKAQYYYQNVIETNTNSPWNNAKNSGAVLTLLAYISQLHKDYHTSLIYNKLALDWRKNHKQEDLYISSLLNIGNSFLDLKEYDSAFYYLTMGLDLANKQSLHKLKEFGYKNLYSYYLNKNNWKSALRYYKLFSEAKDSVFAENNRFNVSLFETNQILSESEKKNEILKNENDIQKLNIRIKTIQIVVLLVFIILSFLIIALIYRLYIKNKRSKLALKTINQHLDQEIEDRKKIEEQLRESESLHRFLTDNSMDVICRTGKDLKLSYISPSCRNIYGFTSSEMLAMTSQADIIHPDFHRILKDEFDEMILLREPTKFTYRTLCADGTYFWAESHVNPIFDETTGELKELISVVRDVSHRIDQEEALVESAKQKELLIREIHHRAKNNFAILISLMNLQLVENEDKKLQGCLDELKLRVRTMALVHDQLYRSKNIITLSFSEYLKNLSIVVSKAFQKDGIVLHTNIEDCYFDIDTALPLGLIVNELLTNAFKYAFNNRSGGNIWVEFRPVLEDEKDPELEDIYWILTVRDDGVGLPAGFELNDASTLGMQVITVLTGQLQARLKIEHTGGACFTILLPDQD
jgi:PAS domain S-box-containing protein